MLRIVRTIRIFASQCVNSIICPNAREHQIRNKIYLRKACWLVKTRIKKPDFGNIRPATAVNLWPVKTIRKKTRNDLPSWNEICSCDVTMCTDKYSYLVRHIGAMRLLREIRQIVGNPSVRYNNERGVFMKHWSNALLLGCPKNDICHLWLHHSPSWYASQLRSFSWASMNKQLNFCESEVAAKKTRNISLVSIMKQIHCGKVNNEQ